MAYKIAVGTSDEINVDLKFGELTELHIYEADGENYSLSEKREIDLPEQENERSENHVANCSQKGCGNGGGCGGSSGISARVLAVSDCRCIVCTKVGFQAQKQLERKAISYFDVECTIDEALGKITNYYKRINRD